MLPRAELPARRLPYTTADMAERLAKKKAEQDAASFKAFPGGVTKAVVEEDKGGGGGLWPSWGEIGNAIKSVGNTAKSVGNMAVGTINTVAATPIDMADWANQQLVKYVAGKEPVDQFDPASVGSFNLLGETSRGLDASTRRLIGDITATPGFGKPSASPTATDIKQQGWVNGLGNAALDYGNLAATVAPFVGPAAKGIQGIRGAQVATEIPYRYGVHISPIADLAEIKARQMLQQQSMAGDAFPGSSYMWDAKSPNVFWQTFENPQLNRHLPSGQEFNLFELTEADRAAIPKPNVYLTRAPANTVFQDANIPGSAGLRVAGNQEVLEQLPSDRAALQAAFDKYGITQRSEIADRLEAKFRGMNPQVRRDIRLKPLIKVEENLRGTIRNQGKYYTTNFPSMMKLDYNAPLAELLKNPEARNFVMKFTGFDSAELDDIMAQGYPR